MKVRFGLPLLVFGAFSLGASSAWAQSGQQPAPAPAVGSEPGLTTATYGDWVVRCVAGQGGAPGKVCEVGQTIQVQGQTAPVAQVAFGKIAGDAMRMIAVLPVNVDFPGAVKVYGSDKDAQPLDLAWTRCLPGGCFAENAGANEAIRRWRAQAGAGHLSFKDAAGRDVTIPLSFRGLPQALDAFAKD